MNSPIFIVGCGHSGTSLMLAMLDSHSNICAVPYESRIFLDKKIDTQKIKQWTATTLHKGKKRWAEKTPKHIMCIDKIFSYDKKAQVICMIRDGRDVCCSIAQREDGCSFTSGIDRWTTDNEASKVYWNDPRVLVVKYEDMIVDLTTTLQKIMLFLNEKFEKEMLNFYQTQRDWYSNHSIRQAQINSELFDGRGRWKTEMTKEQQAQFKQSKANALLLELGYVSTLDWFP